MSKNNHKLFACIAMISMTLAGCATQQIVTSAGSQPPLVLDAATDIQPFQQALASLTLPPKTPQAAPQGVPDGPYSGTTPNGEEFKTFVKNGYFDESLVVYYPNLITQLRTDLVNGLYDGWVTMYLPTGLSKQKVLFHQGVMQEAIVYNAIGKPEFHFWFNNEQPTSGIRYDNTGKAVESMF